MACSRCGHDLECICSTADAPSFHNVSSLYLADAADAFVRGLDVIHGADPACGCGHARREHESGFGFCLGDVGSPDGDAVYQCTCSAYHDKGINP